MTVISTKYFMVYFYLLTDCFLTLCKVAVKVCWLSRQRIGSLEHFLMQAEQGLLLFCNYDFQSLFPGMRTPYSFLNNLSLLR